MGCHYLRLFPRYNFVATRVLARFERAEPRDGCGASAPATEKQENGACITHVMTPPPKRFCPSHRETRKWSMYHSRHGTTAQTLLPQPQRNKKMEHVSLTSWHHRPNASAPATEKQENGACVTHVMTPPSKRFCPSHRETRKWSMCHSRHDTTVQTLLPQPQRNKKMEHVSLTSWHHRPNASAPATENKKMEHVSLTSWHHRPNASAPATEKQENGACVTHVMTPPSKRFCPSHRETRKWSMCHSRHGTTAQTLLPQPQRTRKWSMYHLRHDTTVQTLLPQPQRNKKMEHVSLTSWHHRPNASAPATEKQENGACVTHVMTPPSKRFCPSHRETRKWSMCHSRHDTTVQTLLPQPQRNKKMEHVSLTSWHHRPNASAPATEKQENGACVTHVMTPPSKRFCPSHRETRKWSMCHSRHDTTAQTLLPQPQRNKKMEHVSLTSWHHRPNASAPATEKQENGACVTHVMTPPSKRFCPSHRETRKWSMCHSRHGTTAQTLLPQPQRNKKMEHVSLTSWHHRPNASAPATEKQENGACVTHVMTPPPKRSWHTAPKNFPESCLFTARILSIYSQTECPEDTKIETALPLKKSNFIWAKKTRQFCNTLFWE